MLRKVLKFQKTFGLTYLVCPSGNILTRFNHEYEIKTPKAQQPTDHTKSVPNQQPASTINIENILKIDPHTKALFLARVCLKKPLQTKKSKK